MIDNIVIGQPVEDLTLDDLGIRADEDTVTLTLEEAKEMDFFLPRILVHLGLFKTTSEVKRISADREKSTKIKDPDARKLWRKLDRPEMTNFKIGKQNFWLIVGDVTIV